MLVVVRFRIAGTLRFLSHAETLSLFQKACVRAAISLQYSEGFNPRPKISLPLPRSVGVEAREDLLCLRVQPCAAEFDNERFATDLARRLPRGCDVLSAEAATPGTSFHPKAAEYVFEVRPQYASHTLIDGARSLLHSETLEVQRRTDARGHTRRVDVRPFIEAIEVNDNRVTVHCRISGSGSVRVGEILELLGLEAGLLDSPIVRTAVQWREKRN
jgi:radical SAM-linked protein